MTIAALVSKVLMTAVVGQRGQWEEVCRASKNRHWYLFLGLCNPFLYYLILLHAYDLLSAQQAQPLSLLFWQGPMEACDNTARISNLIYLSPPLSLLFIAILVGERIHMATIVGLFLIMLGVAIQQGILRRLIHKRR